ncbi:LuxR C-terminal-related transcriptional regulator [Streptomyces sp. NPDC002574]|uniref:LuxR C-terminal-related transcriptional regulator n=1 Tax=Streptomyces sp. NPDC002574 TaxID=3364652 RepID=UPI00367493ED
MSTQTSRIAVVEQHSLVRLGLETLLSGSTLLTVVALAADPSELPSPAAQRLDVIVYGAPPVTGPSFAKTVDALALSGRVLVVADFAGWQPVTEALRAGAFGCVSKQADEEELLRAVETVALGGLHIAPGLATRLHSELRQPASTPAPALAHREREALRLLATGLTHGQIARRMGLTEATVSTYVKRIRNKLNVRNKADLTRKAIELGLLQDEEFRGNAALASGYSPAA